MLICIALFQLDRYLQFIWNSVLLFRHKTNTSTMNDNKSNEKIQSVKKYCITVWKAKPISKNKVNIIQPSINKRNGYEQLTQLHEFNIEIETNTNTKKINGLPCNNIDEENLIKKITSLVDQFPRYEPSSLFSYHIGFRYDRFQRQLPKMNYYKYLFLMQIKRNDKHGSIKLFIPCGYHKKTNPIDETTNMELLPLWRSKLFELTCCQNDMIFNHRCRDKNITLASATIAKQNVLDVLNCAITKSDSLKKTLK